MRYGNSSNQQNASLLAGIGEEEQIFDVARPQQEVSTLDLQSTHRQAFEDALHESEIRFGQLIRLLPDPLYTCDASGAITFYNEAAAIAWGRAPRIGDPNARFCGSWKVYWPDGTFVPPDQYPMTIALREGRAFRNSEAILERQDGTRITALVNIDPIRDENGRIVGAINSFRDITNLKRTEESLRESEEKFRAIVDTTPECVKLVAADGRLLHMNAAGLAMIGTDSLEAVAGRSVYDVIAPEDRETYRLFNEKICRGEKGSLQFDIVGLDGTHRHMETHAVPLRNTDGMIVHLGVTRDVSERKRTEEALRKTEKLAAVGRLAATVAHEINNPLEAVTNLLYLIREDPSLSPAARERLAMAEQELDRVAHITKQTLGYYRDGTPPAWLNVSQVVDDLIEVYSYRSRNRDIVIEKELDPSAVVFASQGELHQVFSNLLVNAVDAIRQNHGRILVRVRTGRDWVGSGRKGVRISVADTGCGIDPSQRSRIFDAFYTTKGDVGTGLGLWLTRTLLQKCDGRIRVHSRVQPGESGTVFSVFWPAEPGVPSQTLKN